MTFEKTISVFVRLLDEGSEAARGTQAVLEGPNVCRLLPSPDYDPEDEVWEFLPGAIVRFKPSKDADGNDILLVYEAVDPLSE